MVGASSPPPITTTTQGPLTYSQLCRAAWLQRELQSLSLWITLWWDSSPASHISSKAQSLIQSLTGSQIHLCSFLLPPPERKALKLWWPLIPLKAHCGFLWQSVSPHWGSSDVVYHGVPMFHVLHATASTMQVFPMSPASFVSHYWAKWN